MDATNSLERKTAVIVTDIQGDFTEFRQGSLAIPDTGKDYLAAVESATRRWKNIGCLIIGSQDWHPENHISFYTRHSGKKPGDIIQIDGVSQQLWPPHCVRGTKNARILIDNDLFFATIKKATYVEFDSYSVFQDTGGHETELDGILRNNKITTIIIYGLATDFCVKYTTLDAIKRRYTTIVLVNLCRGITPEGTSQALQEMEQAGAIITSEKP